MAIEIQLDILRYLIFNRDTVVFGPPQEHEDGMPRRCLSILRVSKHFSTLASSVLYGENSFVVSNHSILYHRHNSGTQGGPTDTRTVLFERNTGADCFTMLEKLSVTTPGQNMLRRLSITASQDMMDHFYDYTLLVTLIRMRGLQHLRFVFKEDEVGNGLNYFESDGEGPEIAARRFMKLVDCELTHAQEVMVEDSTVANYTTDYGVVLLQVVSDLRDRNRAWVKSEAIVQTFSGGFMWKDGGF